MCEEVRGFAQNPGGLRHHTLVPLPLFNFPGNPCQQLEQEVLVLDLVFWISREHRLRRQRDSIDRGTRE